MQSHVAVQQTEGCELKHYQIEAARLLLIFPARSNASDQTPAFVNAVSPQQRAHARDARNGGLSGQHSVYQDKLKPHSSCFGEQAKPLVIALVTSLLHRPQPVLG
ncbi:hypothetical protein EVAR_53702_1 [Eumeta japonica]|uniref:Uncharacterized protein n=1 Tax=Eumeta variegata TaxID=151549 RepID=A0A4C1Z848_EUMVA|nr:hypothetical protein EVAR_53702_1 [Eumeta japonica]